jgi:hypothetical protein
LTLTEPFEISSSAFLREEIPESAKNLFRRIGSLDSNLSSFLPVTILRRGLASLVILVGLIDLVVLVDLTGLLVLVDLEFLGGSEFHSVLEELISLGFLGGSEFLFGLKVLGGSEFHSG